MQSKPDMPSLARRRDFSDSPVGNLAEGESKAELKGKLDFDADVPLSETELEKAVDSLPSLPLLQGRRWRPLTRAMLWSLAALVLTQTGLGLWDAWQQSPWLFGLYSLVTTLVLAWGGSAALREYRLLQRLKGAEDLREQGHRLSASMQMGEADGFIAKLGIENEPEGWRHYLSLCSDEHNDAEKLKLFEASVITRQDERARRLVNRYAMEAAALLAASPLALLDMGIMLWRNQKMIREVALCYGVELGYWSRIRLIRGILLNIFYAGTSELVTDLGTQLLSVEMTGKLSARLGQGLGGGLLTARLGYQAMALCRPLSFTETNKPRLSRLHQQLLADLRTRFSGALNGSMDSRLQRNKDFTNQ
ncbi:TIGR01620 family protein [Shewanella cyperi]|uniref:TIGR01620 family protein n=1 Tax=Shewanella cyperi TaxID=2814292 RepID=UPI001A943CE5|nr:TIGR01620 family protein [Shewanella cyperi]QSX42031.1 TIGR01620 family protein [Shewanella cyperi]